MEVWASTPERMSPAEIGAFARRVEAMGFTGLQVPDAIHDGLLLAAMALHATTRLKVCTGVLVAFPRSPMTVAVAAWDLQAMSGGRFELGLGTQIEQNVVERYSAKWESPLGQMREYIESLRAIFASFQTGVPLHYEGKHYRFTRLQPFFNPGPIEHPGIPILMGAVGPKMTELAGALADGMITHPTNTPPRYIQEVCKARLQSGAEKAGGSLQAFRLMLGTLAATGVDAAAVDQAREKQRQLLGFLYSTPAYWPSLELFGWQEKGEQLRQLTREKRWHEMAAIIDDAMLDAFVPHATYDGLADCMLRRYQGLAARVTLPAPDNPAEDPLLANAVRAMTRAHAD
ncbi:MAG TPA: TIGR03617 family F420-dependent LLM class oxidoreductase [Pseudomonadales bacterium]